MKKRIRISPVTAAFFLISLLLAVTTLTQSVWGSVSKPDSPRSAVELWTKTVSAPSASGVISLDGTDVLEPDYFGAKFIPGISTCEPFGPWDNMDVGRIAYPSDKLLSVRIPALDDSYKGSIGVYYRNVGNYQGRSVDLKATLTDYEFYESSGEASQMIFWARTNKIGLCVAGEQFIDIRYDFLDSETGEPLDLKAFMTFDDVDWGQAVQVLQNPGQLYVPEQSNLRCMPGEGSQIFISDAAWYDDRSVEAHNSSPEDSFMTMFQGSSQLQRFYSGYYFRGDYISKQNFLTSYSDEEAMQIFCANLDYFGYSGEPLAATEPSTPVKEVSDLDETGTENTLSDRSEAYLYSIYHNIPNENPENYYESYAVTDTLADCLYVISTSVQDEQNNDVSDDFTVTQEGQQITFTANDVNRSSFYYNTYRFNIEVGILEDADLAPYKTEETEGYIKYAIENTASTLTHRMGEIRNDTNRTITYVSEDIPPVGSMDITKSAIVIHDGSISELQSGTEEQPVRVEKGDVIEYQIDVSRSSTAGFLSGRFTVTDEIPKGAIWSTDTLSLDGNITGALDNSSASIVSIEESDGVITWILQDLDNSEGAHLSFRVTVPSDDMLLKNTAILHVPEEPDKPSTTTYHEVLTPKLSAEKSSNPKNGTTVKAGDVITYGVTIKNNGKTAAKNVMIRDFIPEGTTYVDEGVKCSMGNAQVGYINESNMVYAILPALNPGKSAALSFKVSVDQNLKLSEIRNVAQFREASGNDPEKELLANDGFTDTNVIRHPLGKVTVNTTKATPDSKSTGASGSGTSGKTAGSGASKASPVKTGDISHPILFGFLTLLSISLILLLLSQKKKH